MSLTISLFLHFFSLRFFKVIATVNLYYEFPFQRHEVNYILAYYILIAKAYTIRTRF